MLLNSNYLIRLSSIYNLIIRYHLPIPISTIIITIDVITIMGIVMAISLYIIMGYIMVVIYMDVGYVEE